MLLLQLQAMPRPWVPSKWPCREQSPPGDNRAGSHSSQGPLLSFPQRLGHPVRDISLQPALSGTALAPAQHCPHQPWAHLCTTAAVMALLTPSQTHAQARDTFSAFSKSCIMSRPRMLLWCKGLTGGATALQVPAQVEPFILTDEVPKTSHCQRNFCNVFSWRNETMSAHKAVLSNCYSWTEASALISHLHFLALMLFACMLLASCV